MDAERWRALHLRVAFALPPNAEFPYWIRRNCARQHGVREDRVQRHLRMTFAGRAVITPDAFQNLVDEPGRRLTDSYPHKP